jgi:predicted DNA-binding transcriptional regulator YafY
MTEPTTRVLAMLELLQSNHRMGGPELAARLGVDERTVRRYALKLTDLGIPVRADRGRYGGYRILPGYRLPPLMLTEDEAVDVVLGLLAGRRLGLSAARDTEPDAVLAKIERVLPERLRERVRGLRERLEFTLMPGEGAPATAAVVLTLGHAAHIRRRVRLSYRSWRGERTDRDLDPYGLVFHSRRWYVTGLDHRSGEIRTFRIDRVLAAEPLTETFADPGDFDPVQHVIGSLAAVPYAHRVEVLFETTLAEARRRIPPSVATLTEVPGGVLLAARAERLDGMAQLLAGLGWPFVIHAPPELRDAVRDLAATLITQAGREAPGRSR